MIIPFSDGSYFPWRKIALYDNSNFLIGVISPGEDSII